MNVRSSRILVVFMIFLTSCELLVEVDVPMDNANKLVLNGLQVSDSVWSVELSRSNHILSPLRENHFTVSNATVTIHNPDGSTEVLNAVGPGRYKGTTKPIPGNHYRITAAAAGVEAVESEMTMPAVIPITKVEWDSSNLMMPPANSPQQGWYINNRLPVNITFNDPPGERNYYQVEAWGTFRSRYFLGPPPAEPMYDTAVFPITMYIDDPALSFEDDYKRRFSDHVFDGSTFSGAFVAHVYSSEFQRMIGLELRFITISEPLYKYMETLELSEQASGDPFSQPVQVYSNVSNTFGIFGGISYYSKKFVIKQP